MKGVKRRDNADLVIGRQSAREGCQGGREGETDRQRQTDKWTVFCGKEQENCEVPDLEDHKS